MCLHTRKQRQDRPEIWVKIELARLLSRLRTPCYTWNRPARSPLCPRAPLRPFSRPSTLHTCPALPSRAPQPSPPFHSRGVACYPNPSGWGGRRPCSDSSCVTRCGPNARPLPQGHRQESSRQAAEVLEAELPRGPRKDTVGQSWRGTREERRGESTRPPDEAAAHQTRCSAALRHRGSRRADTAPAASPRVRLVLTPTVSGARPPPPEPSESAPAAGSPGAGPL